MPVAVGNLTCEQDSLETRSTEEADNVEAVDCEVFGVP